MSARPRIAFFGTPAFAVPSLEAAHAAGTVVVVVTQPDKPAGRGRHLESPPIKSRAAELGLAVWQPESIKGRGFADQITALDPDLIVTAAYGKLFGRALLAAPRAGCLNVHASLLPRWRGAAPINRAILAGDVETGVTVMRMEPGLDTGPMLLALATAIDPDETALTLGARLAAMGAQALAAVLADPAAFPPRPQDEARATVAPMLSKADAALDLALAAGRLHDRVRGLVPWPGAVLRLRGAEVRLHATRVVDHDGDHGPPGTILDLAPRGIDVACGRGVLRLLELQAPGRNRLDAREFLAGARLSRSDRFENG